MPISDKNKRVTDRAIKALDRELGKIRKKDFPEVLRKVGEIAVNHSRRTHTYRNRTGVLEASHAFVVVEPGKTEEIIFDDRGKTATESFSSPENQVHLLIYAGKQYGFTLERNLGFDVLIQTF